MRSVHAVSGSSSPARSARMVAMSCELRMSSVSGPSRVPAETAIGSMVVNSVSRRSGRTVDVLAAGGGTHVSAEAGQSSRWGRGARLTRRVREEYPVYFDRNATQNAAKRSGSAGMDRRPSPHRENWAAWVSPQAARSRELRGAPPPPRRCTRDSQCRAPRRSSALQSTRRVRSTCRPCRTGRSRRPPAATSSP